MISQPSDIDAKAACVETFNTWLKNTGDGRSDTWDESATSDCPSRPPKLVSKTCTTNGCTKPVYALDNKIVGNTEETYDAAFKAKYDALCSEEVVAKRTAKASSTSADGEQLTNCGQKQFWFFDGENVGSSDAWKTQMCESNKQNLLGNIHSGPIEYCDTNPIYICGGEEILVNGDREQAKAEFEKCLSENKDAQCRFALNNDAITRDDGGPYTSPTPDGMAAPVGEDCAISYWYCGKSKKIHREPNMLEKNTKRIKIAKKNARSDIQQLAQKTLEFHIIATALKNELFTDTNTAAN